MVDFYRSTLPVSGRPAYSRTIRMLEERHGDEFVLLWNEAHRLISEGGSNAELSDISGMRVRYESDSGPIEYLVLQSAFRFSTPYALFIHVPMGMTTICAMKRSSPRWARSASTSPSNTSRDRPCA